MAFKLSHVKSGLLASIGYGILVGTALAIIVPQGVDSIYTSNDSSLSTPPKLIKKHSIKHEDLNRSVAQDQAVVSGHSSRTQALLTGIAVVKNDETLSTDCIAKRNEILKLNVTRDEDSEHIPQCTSKGRYEPIQCHKIGYCWCVNKYGQAIKNSAALADKKPDCDSSIYESESNDLLVVTGVSANRLKALLRGGAASSSTSTVETEYSGFDTSSLANSNHDSSGRGTSKSSESEFSRRVSESPEPSLSLIPNECNMSRDNAKERAEKLTDDSIWVPECDQSNNKLYSGMQCHKSKICWCVDQVTGLPLRTSEQLTTHASINCTDIRSIVDTATAMFDHDTSLSSKKQTTLTFSGFSESCDAHMRVDFVHSLIDQFRHQLSEHLRLNPTSDIPEGLTSTNPYRLNEVQVARWKFSAMDSDHDDKLDDREWSRFKNNFKLVDSIQNVQELHRQQPRNTHISLSPLGITRVQRRCWRDFLQFCGNGDLLTDESISLPKWLSCTELPSKAKQISSSDDKTKTFDSDTGLESNYANSKAAAIARSKKKNPFLGILKPN